MGAAQNGAGCLCHDRCQQAEGKCSPLSGCAVLGREGSRCDFECAVEQVVVTRRREKWRTHLGWLAGYKPTLFVEILPNALESMAQRTGLGILLSQEPHRQSANTMVEVWGWEASQKYGPKASCTMSFNVPASTELLFRARAADDDPSRGPGQGREVLGEARFRIDEDVDPAGAEAGSSNFLSLPLVLDGRVCGSASLITRLRHDVSGRIQPGTAVMGGGPRADASRGRAMEVDGWSDRRSCDDPVHLLDDLEVFWSPRPQEDQPSASKRTPVPGADEVVTGLPRKPWRNGFGPM